MKKSQYKKNNTRKVIIVAVIAVVVLAAAGAATYLFTTAEKKYPVTDVNGQVKNLTVEEMKVILDVPTFYQGITINGVDMSGKTKEEAAAVFAGEPALDSPDVNITLEVDGVPYPLDSAVIKIASNLSDVIGEAVNYNKTSTNAVEAGALVERYAAYVELQKTAKNYVTEYTADTAEVDAAVHGILDTMQLSAVDAAATAFDVGTLSFTVSESSAGLTVDVDAAIAAVKASIDAKVYTAVIPVSTAVVEPAVTKEQIDGLLGLVSSSTTKTTDVANRNTNIDLVCKTIDGLVLQPGEFFNFNEFVGKRTAEKGYKEAGGIFDGTLRQELGGGICQANGTLFHSVMKADLQIDERHPHSWPSTYVDTGTDATVTWDGPNFQFTNNTEYPVAIHAFYSDRHVTMEIYGRPVADGMTIEIEGEVLSTTPPGPTEYVADPLALVGTNTSVRSAHNAISAACYKIYLKDGVEVKRELAFSSSYRAITEKISVGVLDPDGFTIYPMDPLTGVVLIPTPVPTVVPPAPPETAPPAAIPSA